MKSCSFCGTEMPDEANFCPYCGLEVNSEGITEDYYQNIYEKGIPSIPDEDYGELVVPFQHPTSKEDEKKQLKTVLIITAIVITIVILITIIFATVINKEEKAQKGLKYVPGKLTTQGDNQIYENDTLNIKFVCPKSWDCSVDTEFSTALSGHVEFSAWYEDRIGTFVSYTWEYKEDAEDEYKSWVNFIKDERDDMLVDRIDLSVCGRPFVGYIRSNGMSGIEMQLYGNAPQGYVVNIDVFAKDKEEALEVLSHYE